LIKCKLLFFGRYQYCKETFCLENTGTIAIYGELKLQIPVPEIDQYPKEKR